MEDGDTKKYHPSWVVQDFVFLSRKRGCIGCISLQVSNILEDNSYCIRNFNLMRYCPILST